MPNGLRTADFEIEIPPALIAARPAAVRDQSRLLAAHRDSQTIEHQQFPDLLDYLRGGDVLVLNDSRVIPARLRGHNPQTGGHFEILLLEETETNVWWAMLRPGRRARLGTRIEILDPGQMGRTAGRDSDFGEPSTSSVESLSRVVEPKLDFLGEKVTARQSLAPPLKEVTARRSLALPLAAGIVATVEEINAAGHRRLRFSGVNNILAELDKLGEVPLPPYIGRDGTEPEDRERYQTVYARAPGSVAAPTAGLHFTEALLEKIRARGVTICFVTLHVGAGTFAPVKTEFVADHRMHRERFEISAETARLIAEGKAAGARLVAAGTTTLRVLESVAAANAGRIVPGSGATGIFIYPPYEFKIVDSLLTNFHLTRSTLLMLVCAFAAPGETRGREFIFRAYREAVERRYRFFSYGDAMLLL